MSKYSFIQKHWVIYHAHGPKAYKDVPYMECINGEQWICHLCGSGVISSIAQMEHHCCSTKHKKRYKLLLDYKKDCNFEDCTPPMPYYIGEMSWCSGSLPNQLKECRYMEKKGARIGRCLLCNSSAMAGYDVIVMHCRGTRHLKKYKEEEMRQFQLNGLLYRLNMSKSINPRLEHLGLERWKQHVNSIVLKVVQAKEPDTAKQLWKKAMVALYCYEQLECLSVMEIAIWKASCLNFDDALFLNMQEMEDMGAMDENFDPKKHRREIWVTSGIDVILSLVVAYLGPMWVVKEDILTGRKDFIFKCLA